MRELDILTVDGAIALMGLFLRSRGQCLVPGEIATFPGMGRPAAMVV
jgi:hypothetical protein